jgi:hypothetical protein
MWRVKMGTFMKFQPKAFGCGSWLLLAQCRGQEKEQKKDARRSEQQELKAMSSPVTIEQLVRCTTVGDAFPKRDQRELVTIPSSCTIQDAIHVLPNLHPLCLIFSSFHLFSFSSFLRAHVVSSQTQHKDPGRSQGAISSCEGQERRLPGPCRHVRPHLHRTTKGLTHGCWPVPQR